MISVERRGRLGNEMFQFAFGLAAARQLGTMHYMADGGLRRWFTLAPHAGNTARLLRDLRYQASVRLHRYRRVEVENRHDPYQVRSALTDYTHYGGYFQSAAYFAGSEAEVRRAFRVLPQHERAFLEKYAHPVVDGYACVHVRRTDYLDWGGVNLALPFSYYRDALARVDGAGERSVLFVSDDLDEVRREFADMPNARFESNSPIIDLQLLTRADVVVTSNSSFGWWGAWLNTRPGVEVFAPRYWLGFLSGAEWLARVVPKTWTQIPVEVHG